MVANCYDSQTLHLSALNLLNNELPLVLGQDVISRALRSLCIPPAPLYPLFLYTVSDQKTADGEDLVIKLRSGNKKP